MIDYRQTKGFTLIELLVVMSIISLLSSIVMSSISNGREKARLGAGLQMSSNLAHTYNAEAAGIWDFDESSGNALDTSDNKNTATIYEGATRTTGIHGSAFQFDGSTQYLRTNALVNLGSTWTFATWVYFNNLNDQIFISFGSTYYLRLISSKIYLRWTDGGGAARSITESLTRTTGRWYFVVATHNNNSTVLYVDGKEVARDSTYDSSTISQYLYIGKYLSTYYLNGMMDEVHIYTQSLLAQDIEKMYLAGVSKHLTI